MNKPDYTKPYGVWRVTTEGDCEGRSTCELGTHAGYIDEIAFALADQAMYGLNFSKVNKLNLKKPTRKSVHVSLDIESGTWNSEEAILSFAKKMLNDRPVVVIPSNYYASFVICSKDSPETVEFVKAEQDALRKRALAKLSAADKKVLGIS